MSSIAFLEFVTLLNLYHRISFWFSFLFAGGGHAYRNIMMDSNSVKKTAETRFSQNRPNLDNWITSTIHTL